MRYTKIPKRKTFKHIILYLARLRTAIIFKQCNYLGIAVVTNNRAMSGYETTLRPPLPLENLGTIRTDFGIPNRTIQQFNVAGCTASPPKRR